MGAVLPLDAADVDGIDLRAQDGNGVVWKSGDTSFETRRAIEAGLLVEEEVARGAGRGAPESGGPAHGATLSIAQREREGIPLSGRTARISANGRTDTTRRISRSVKGGEANGASYDPAISGNGRFVAFVSEGRT